MDNQDFTENINSLPIGTVLNNRYKIKQVVCSHKYSILYEAIDTKFRENVFIRELYVNNVFTRVQNSFDIDKSNVPDSLYSQYVESFEEEARYLRQNENTYIVKSTDLFRENNTSYYVMEYVEGEFLSDKVLRRNQTLSDFTAYSYLVEILDGLSSMHSNGFWHLDLTPSSVMIDNDGHVKIMDFGHLKLIDDEQTVTNTTHDPEELVNHDLTNIGPWTDFYILGTTLYNLLTGKIPPSTSEINETTTKLYNFPSSVSKKMQRLVLWMMTPNIFRRPQDVNEVSDFITSMNETLKNNDGNASKSALTNNSSKKDNIEINNNSNDDDDDDDEAGFSNKTLKAMQFFIFVVILGLVVFLAYKLLIGDDNNKNKEKNELNLTRESKDDDFSLVDSLRSESDIFFPTEETEEKKEDTKTDADTTKTEVPTTPETNDAPQATQETEVKNEVSDTKTDNTISNNPASTVESTNNTDITNQPPTTNNATQPETSDVVDKPQRIIVGSFNNSDNANARLDEIKASGFKATVEKEGEYYKVVVTAANSEEAKKELDQLKNKYPDAWIAK